MAAAHRRGRGRGPAAARGPSAECGPPLHVVPPYKNNSDESFSSLESASTDDGEELARILDPDELEARVLSKSLHIKHRDEKRRRAGAEFVEAMNEEALETGLWQDTGRNPSPAGQKSNLPSTPDTCARKG